MHLGILRGKLGQGHTVLQALREVGGSNAARGWVNEIADGNAPRRRDDVLNGREEVARQPLHGNVFRQQPVQDHGLLCCYAHALAEDWIKAAEGIAYREQPCRERLQALEMPPYAARQLVADDISQRSGVPDRVIDGRGAQALDEIHESRAVARRRIAMIASDGKQPSLLLDRKQERSAAAGRRGWQDDVAQPVGIVIDWSLDDGARVS